MPATAKKFELWTIPAGTKPTRCSGPNCGKLIYFVMNPHSGRPMPLDPDVPGGKRPSETDDRAQLDLLTGETADVFPGKGASHFGTCVDAEMFRKKIGQ